MSFQITIEFFNMIFIQIIRGIVMFRDLWWLLEGLAICSTHQMPYRYQEDCHIKISTAFSEKSDRKISLIIN